MRGRYQTVGTRHGLQSRLNSTVEITSPDNAMSFAVGQGDGALAIAGHHSMQLSTDFDPDTGGVDPLLGFASGGAHLASRVKLGHGLSVAMGVTNQHRDIESEFLNVSDANRQFGQMRLLGDYDASAMNIRADYTLSNGLNFAASYTRLSENQAFFGVRSLDRNDFGKATVSHSMTFAGDFAVTDTLRLFASSTVAKSYADQDAGFRFKGATSTAWQLGFAKNRLLGSTDNLRVTFAQPLMLENGTVDFQSVGVVNRETGEKGIITQKLDISQPGDRRHRVEAYYGAGIFGGFGDVALFSSYELRDVRSDIARWTMGAKARIAF